MNDTAATFDDLTPRLSPEWAVRSFHEERIPLSPPLPDRDLRWRWAVAIIAALLLHISVVTTLDDGFERSKSPLPEPVPVEIITEQPKPPPPPPEPKPVEKPPELPKPPEPQQPLPYRSSNGDLTDKPSGSSPQTPERSEQTQPAATAAATAAPEPQASTPKPSGAPALPSQPSPQATPVPPATPRETQEAMIAPPLPSKKPPTPPAEQGASVVTPQSETAARTTEQEDPHVGEGGSDKYLRDMKEQVLRNYFYPPTAEMFHVTGTVVYDITLDRSGTVRGVRIVQSAGSLLDRAGFDAIMRGSPYGPLPSYIKASGVVVTMEFGMPVVQQDENR
ncbi:MAG TPA: TonB family protein [Hypericibacter adhaerens]|uniref:TonB C-terminal domain-containing protein n=1 Tax=Hypericibacter adhaerens TaxID=2602016 RepID=A0A5J6MXL9_9PROT|nr:energy transducer TonB [Hypericibacter adhaerens]QEX22428.1 hypothetical protein FRZ61_23590 [Hypericibacter adhaerens]HWA43488.1 TonB family protein [Hypericibacter adhaerens]